MPMAMPVGAGDGIQDLGAGGRPVLEDQGLQFVCLFLAVDAGQRLYAILPLLSSTLRM